MQAVVSRAHACAAAWSATVCRKTPAPSHSVPCGVATLTLPVRTGNHSLAASASHGEPVMRRNRVPGGSSSMATCIDVSSVASSRSRASGSPGTPSGISRAITTMTTPTSGAARRSGRGPPAPSRLSAGHVRVPNDASPAAANRAIGTGRSIAGSRRSTSSRTTTHAPRASRRRARWTMVSSRPMPTAAARSSGATDHAEPAELVDHAGEQRIVPSGDRQERPEAQLEADAKPPRGGHERARSPPSPAAPAPAGGLGPPGRAPRAVQAPRRGRRTDGPAGRGPQGRRHTRSAAPAPSGRRAPRRRARRLPRGVRASSRHRR